MNLTDLVPVIQLSVSPVLMFSGIGILLLTMTNRFGRIIDRTRYYVNDANHQKGPAHDKMIAELRILWKRAKVMRATIFLASAGLLSAGLMIIALFSGTLFQINTGNIVIGTFLVCMGCEIVSLVLFIIDIDLSLKALAMEMPFSEF